MPDKIVVTGAAGFIGSHLTSCLLRSGYDVVACDIVEARPALLDKLCAYDNFSFRQGDLNDRSFVDSLLDSAVGVIHAAGSSRASTAKSDPIKAIDSTARPVIQLMQAIQHSSLDWFVLLSSREVEKLDNHIVNSSDDLYAVLKLNAELMTQCFCRDAGIPLHIYRLSDVYGSSADHAGKLLPIFIRKAVNSEPLTVFDNESRFYFTHIDDVVDTILADIPQYQNTNHAVTIRRLWKNDGISAYELALLFRQLANKPLIIRSEISSGKNNTDNDVSIEEQTRFQPKIDLKTGLRRLLNHSMAENS